MEGSELMLEGGHLKETHCFVDLLESQAAGLEKHGSKGKKAK